MGRSYSTTVCHISIKNEMQQFIIETVGMRSQIFLININNNSFDFMFYLINCVSLIC